MKKFYLLFIILLFSQANNLSAQGFTFVPLGTTFVQLPFSGDTPVVQHRAIVSNTSNEDIHFRFARIVNDLPAGWETQMCYDLCYAPFVDTIALTSDPPYVISPNHTDTFYYIDFRCIGQGLGTAVVRMYNTNNPSNFVEDTFKVQVGSVGITNISGIVDGYELSQNYPNPFNPTTNIEFSLPAQQFVSLRVYDVLGKVRQTLIDNTRLGTGKYKFDFNAGTFPSGIYYYTLSTENFTDTKKMILLK